MKRITALLLVVLMCVSAAILSGCQPKTPTEDNTTTQPTADKPTESKKSETPSKEAVEDGAPFDKPDFINELTLTKNDAEHKKADEIPSSFTLVGSGTLPRIDNRGTIECQAAEAITYMQFTNAVARYVKNKDPENKWDPAADYTTCYSPKSTFYGTGTGVAYYMLEHNGALPISYDSFARSATDVWMIKRSGRYDPKAVDWKVGENDYLESMKYRINGYSSINTSNKDKAVTGDGYYDGASKSVMITNSDNGKKLLEKVKDAVVTGNVVVVQGYKNFVMEKLTSNSGTLGKTGDTVVPYALKHTDNSTWQLSIVGYDDDIEFTACGATMKGAFLVANNEGTGWGTNGYVWVMYDALNTTSEAGEDFKLEEGAEREFSGAFDWYYFLYWDINIVETMPKLYGEVELDVANRTAFQIVMQRTDALNRTASSQTALTWSASNYAWKFELVGTDYFNPAGEQNGPAVTGHYLINFDSLLKDLPEGTSYENFLWGVKVTSTKENAPVTVRKIVVKDDQGNVVFSIDNLGDVIENNSKTYVFDLGNKKSNYNLSGEYHLMNVGTGNYMAPKDDTGMRLVADPSVSKAATPNIKYDDKTGKIVLYRDSKNGTNVVLDVSELKHGSEVRNKPYNDKTSAQTQNWITSFNDDGTLSLYLVNDNGAYYALTEKDGAYVIERARELTANMKWKVERINDPKNATPFFADKTDKGVKIYGTTTAKKINNLSLKVTDATTGNEVKSVDVKAESRLYTTEVELSAGSYIIRIHDKDNNDTPEPSVFYLTVK